MRPEGLLYYTRTTADGAQVTKLAFVEVDPGTMGGPRLAAKLNAYARYWATTPSPAARCGRRWPTAPWRSAG
ncbi:hypothetical protein PUR71_04120 [Streptomyces sp. SP17BM10]|nr:replication-relaxation family protein [Streptomyces sp. SP17BM10]MEE1782119.1 hypothetical protein [Streptomyces sp. SP17BM10]